MQLQHYASVEGSPITNDVLNLKKKPTNFKVHKL